MLKTLLSQNNRYNNAFLATVSVDYVMLVSSFFITTGIDPVWSRRYLLCLGKDYKRALGKLSAWKWFILTMKELLLYSGVDGRWSAVCLNETIGSRLTLQFCTADVITEEWELLCLSWSESPRGLSCVCGWNPSQTLSVGGCEGYGPELELSACQEHLRALHFGNHRSRRWISFIPAIGSGSCLCKRAAIPQLQGTLQAGWEWGLLSLQMRRLRGHLGAPSSTWSGYKRAGEGFSTRQVVIGQEGMTWSDREWV